MKHLFLSLVAVLALSACSEQTQQAEQKVPSSPAEQYLADFEQFNAEMAELANQAEVCATEVIKVFEKYDHLAPENNENFATMFNESQQAEYQKLETRISEALGKARKVVNTEC